MPRRGFSHDWRGPAWITRHSCKAGVKPSPKPGSGKLDESQPSGLRDALPDHLSKVQVRGPW